MTGLCAHYAVISNGDQRTTYQTINLPDHKSEKVIKIDARLTKLSQKQFSLSIYGMSVISNVCNLTR